MSLPAAVRYSIREQVWALADAAGWATLPASVRSKRYEEWTRDPKIGGLLGNYVDPKQVRVYLKDSVIKPYTIARGGDPSRAFRSLGLAEETPTSESYVKPHGRRLADGRVVCWGHARDWKAVLVAVWERAQGVDGQTPYAAVLTAATGPWAGASFRLKAADMSNRLGLKHVIWLDT